MLLFLKNIYFFPIALEMSSLSFTAFILCDDKVCKICFFFRISLLIVCASSYYCISCHTQSAKLILSSKMKIIIICSTSFPSTCKKQKGKVKGVIFRYFKGQKLPLLIFENRFFSLLLS